MHAPVALPSGEGRRRLRHPALFAFAVVLAPALWATFVGSTARHEVLVGVFACAATLLFTLVVCRSSGTPLTLRTRDLVQAWRIPWYVLSGVTEITLVLLKDVLHLSRAQNLYRVCGFDSSSHDPVRIARTVLAVAYTTTAPNFIVVDVDATQSRMLFHQIQASSVPKMAKALGAKG